LITGWIRRILTTLLKKGTAKVAGAISSNLCPEGLAYWRWIRDTQPTSRFSLQTIEMYRIATQFIFNERTILST